MEFFWEELMTQLNGFSFEIKFVYYERTLLEKIYIYLKKTL